MYIAGTFARKATSAGVDARGRSCDRNRQRPSHTSRNPPGGGSCALIQMSISEDKYSIVESRLSFSRICPILAALYRDSLLNMHRSGSH